MENNQFKQQEFSMIPANNTQLILKISREDDTTQRKLIDSTPTVSR